MYSLEHILLNCPFSTQKPSLMVPYRILFDGSLLILVGRDPIFGNRSLSRFEIDGTAEHPFPQSGG